MITALNGIIASSIASVSYDADAQLFFNAESSAGVSLTLTEKNAVNQWVIDAKAAGIWTKKKAIYPIVGGTATAHKFNLKNPLDTNAAFRLAFSGGWTHSATGMLPNGTNAYANTYLTPSTSLALNNTHLSFYSRTDFGLSNNHDIGSGHLAGVAYYTLLILRESNTFYSGININQGSLSLVTAANNSSLGFFNGNRTASNVVTAFKNGTKIVTSSAASSSASFTPIYIGALDFGNAPSNYSNRQCAFSTIGDGLTDLESQLFYQITEKYQVALGRNVNPTQTFYYNSAYNNETNAFLFSTQITNTTIQTATNTLVTDLKTAGVFTKMKALYPMVGGTATTHKFNLINPQDTDAAFRLVFSGGMIHSATGMLPNGTNAYANTFCTTANMALNSAHHSFYSRTDQVAANAYDMGIYQTTPNCNTALIIKAQTGAELVGKINNSGTGTTGTANSNSTGYYITSRTASNLTKTFKNNSLFQTATNLSGAVSTNPYFISANNNLGSPSNYSLKECAFASIGDGLTDLELQLLYQITEKYQVALGRNVNALQSFYYNPAYNNETNAFLFSTQITDNTIQTATNTLVTDLKIANIWTKIKALYPMVGGTATTHKYNLANPQDTNAAFRLVFAGGLTHSSDGVKGNNTNGWASTNLFAGNSMAVNNFHCSFNIYTDAIGTFPQVNMGVRLTTTSQIVISSLSAINETSYMGTLANSISKTVTATTHKGFWCGSRTANNINNLIDPTGAITLQSATVSYSMPTARDIALLCENTGIGQSSFSNFGYSFYSIGDGLTPTEMTAYKLAETNFQTALGRI